DRGPDGRLGEVPRDGGGRGARDPAAQELTCIGAVWSRLLSSWASATRLPGSTTTNTVTLVPRAFAVIGRWISRGAVAWARSAGTGTVVWPSASLVASTVVRPDGPLDSLRTSTPTTTSSPTVSMLVVSIVRSGFGPRAAVRVGVGVGSAATRTLTCVPAG